jgi:glutamine synthetase
MNVRYSDAPDTADMHAIVKAGVKNIANAHGRACTFMAKYATDRAGSSAHVHRAVDGGPPAFFHPGAPHGMSATMQACLAGLLAHADAATCSLAPCANSCKRVTEGIFAPIKAVWATDNRTAGYRGCGADTKAGRG